MNAGRSSKCLGTARGQHLVLGQCLCGRNIDHRVANGSSNTAEGVEISDILKYIAFTMARHVLEVNGTSVALTGSFNPTIFQPQWFARQNLLPAEESAKSED